MDFQLPVSPVVPKSSMTNSFGCSKFMESEFNAHAFSLFRSSSSCRIPDDCIDPRRYPLLAAREAMRQLVDDLLGRSIRVPGAFS
jgi:hypothetical protein